MNTSYYSSTRYVPLMVQQDDVCYIPKIRRSKTPKIYPLVATPSLHFCNCRATPSGSDNCSSISESESPSANPHWKVVRVSRADRACCESDEKRNRSMDQQSEKISELKAIRLFMELPSTKKEKESGQSRRKLIRIPHRKLCPCDKLHPIMRISEDEETIFCSRKKQVQSK